MHVVEDVDAEVGAGIRSADAGMDRHRQEYVFHGISAGFMRQSIYRTLRAPPVMGYRPDVACVSGLEGSNASP